MSSRESSTAVLDHPELPDGEDPTLPLDLSELPEAAETTEEDSPSPELDPATARAVGILVIANETGTLPFGGSQDTDRWDKAQNRAIKRESRWRPEEPYYGWPFFKRLSPGHPHKHEINAVAPKVEEANKGREYGFKHANHHVAVDNTAGTIRALNIKEHVNTFAPEDVSFEGGLNHTGHRRSGYASVQYRRPVSKIQTALGRMRTPEQQVMDERRVALRTIGQMRNLNGRLAEIVEVDESGRLARTLRTASEPRTIRHTLGELSDQGIIPESNPLHARWSEAMDPQNVKAFKRHLIETTTEEINGEAPKTMLLHIGASGIMGSVRPRVVADYLGITPEEWDKQRYGHDEHRTVPREVVDQISFLMKLDNRIVGKVPDGRGGTKNKTALDALIEAGAAQPWTEVSHGPDHKTPMERIENEERAAARTELEKQDFQEARTRIQSAQYGPMLEELNARIANLNAEDEEEKEELASLKKQRERVIAQLRRRGVPVPDEDNKTGNS